MKRSASMERVKFLFDLQGYVVIKGVLSQEEVNQANQAINRHGFSERKGVLRNSPDQTIFSGDQSTGRFDMGGMLAWPQGDREVFRNMMVHPKLVKYLHLLVGKGYRLDHSPLVIAQQKGSEGFSLHGGSISTSDEYTPELVYSSRHGSIYNSLLAVSFQLTDQSPTSGGFCVVPGSHKINFAPTDQMMNGHDAYFRDNCLQTPSTQAGDVVIFSEATIHGCLPWNSEYQRRIALFRFSPSTLAFARGYSLPWPAEFLEDMSDEQMAVMQPPFNNFYDRIVLNENGKVDTTTKKRNPAKMAFDEKVFGQKYY